MCLWVSYKKKYGKKWRKESDPELDPDPDTLVRGTDPRHSTGPLNHPLGFNVATGFERKTLKLFIIAVESNCQSVLQGR